MMKFHLKLKYKKIIFVVSLGTMALGLAVLSVNTKGDIETSIKPVAGNSSGVVASGSPTPGGDLGTPAPNAADAILKAKLQKNAYPEINSVVTQYMEASVKADMATLEVIVSEVDKLNQNELERRYEYIESINNIDCYTLPGLDEDSYIVYVYHESKLVNIETMAPGLIVLYVSRASDGNMVIMLEPLDDIITKKLEVALKREDVQNLIKTVNDNMQQAMAKDANLKNFEEQLEQAVKDREAGASAAPSTAPSPATSAVPAASPSTAPSPATSVAPAATPVATPAASTTPNTAN